MQEAVERLGSPLADPPSSEWDALVFIPEQPGSAEVFTVSMPLWTKDGLSGTAVDLRLVHIGIGLYDTELMGFSPVDTRRSISDLPKGALRAADRPAAVPASAASVPTSDPVPPRWRSLLSAIIDRLVAGDYAGLSRDGLVAHTNDPRDVSIGEWIDKYPGTLVPLPDEAWPLSDHGSDVGREDTWWVVVPLWTAEEGRSDLSLEATVRDDGTEVEVTLHNVHVM